MLENVVEFANPIVLCDQDTFIKLVKDCFELILF